MVAYSCHGRVIVRSFNRRQAHQALRGALLHTPQPHGPGQLSLHGDHTRQTCEAGGDQLLIPYVFARETLVIEDSSTRIIPRAPPLRYRTRVPLSLAMLHLPVERQPLFSTGMGSRQVAVCERDPPRRSDETAIPSWSPTSLERDAFLKEWSNSIGSAWEIKRVPA